MREIERLTATNQSHQRAASRMSKQSGAALQPWSPNKSSLYDVIQNTRTAEAGRETLMRMTSILLYTRWWSRTGSNRRPPACKAGALPAELRPLIPGEGMVGLGGLEPPTSRLSSARSNQLSYKPSTEPAAHRASRSRLEASP